MPSPPWAPQNASASPLQSGAMPQSGGPQYYGQQSNQGAVGQGYSQGQPFYPNQQIQSQQQQVGQQSRVQGTMQQIPFGQGHSQGQPFHPNQQIQSPQPQIGHQPKVQGGMQQAQAAPASAGYGSSQAQSKTSMNQGPSQFNQQQFQPSQQPPPPPPPHLARSTFDMAPVGNNQSSYPMPRQKASAQQSPQTQQQDKPVVAHYCPRIMPDAAMRSSDDSDYAPSLNQLKAMNRRQWTEDQLRATDSVLILQNGTNMFSSQRGMTGFGSPRDVHGKHVHTLVAETYPEDQQRVFIDDDHNQQQYYYQ